MKAKLILKHRGDNNYFLISRTNNSEALYASLNPDGEFEQKLSKQNCDSLFGVVDVELMSDFYGANSKGSVDFKLGSAQGFEDGFNKAMELNKDKVFTLEDMYDAVMLGVCFEDSGIQGISTYEELKEFAIKRALKPTEIEVMIEHHEIKQTKTYNAIKGVKGSGHKITTIGYAPKLDSSGCLILTKKINL